MEKQNKKLLIALFGITIITIAIAALGGYYIGSTSTWTKTYRLNEQFIGTIPPAHNGTNNLAPCNDCLIMKVQDEWWAPSGLMTENLTLFFANEHQLRNDLQDGDMIEVRWKWVDDDRLIRGVQKVNE